jgi:hypothetical protein
MARRRSRAPKPPNVPLNILLPLRIDDAQPAGLEYCVKCTGSRSATRQRLRRPNNRWRGP